VYAENCHKHLETERHQDYHEQKPKLVLRDDQENACADDRAKD
jgi:hypothetical protein